MVRETEVEKYLKKLVEDKGGICFVGSLLHRLGEYLTG